MILTWDNSTYREYVFSVFAVKNTGPFPRLHIDTANIPLPGTPVGMMTETIRTTGLYKDMSEMLELSWRLLATQDSAKVILDPAINLALGGGDLRDPATLCAELALYGPVASDPTMSRTIFTLATEPRRALTAINAARQTARQAACGCSPVNTGRTNAPPRIIP
ncbi:transposase [Microbacterium amylolyticum]|uniref:Uncharacterized protein n=1 Tax=Microbacterium amylolyticum TaxID=936337 RepID=A0ABS4ZIM7_9MICO|nr:transposase [Microbacterium amylolyticum]MBP2436845.1 hypothetical protein [Microbacterium amylolyticum]